ncbi:hypothetical protein K437DRAFT_259936, partial [Tilletiaria anomala UBC 951]
MSYQRPQDTHILPNTSGYQVQGGGYSDYPQQTTGGMYNNNAANQSGYYYSDTPAAGASYGGTPAKDYEQPGWSQQPNAAQHAAQKYSYKAPAQKRRSKWLLIGLPILVLIIAGAVLGAIFGSRAAKRNNSNSVGSAHVDNPKQASTANAHAEAGGVDKLFYGSTDPYGNPRFLPTVNTAAPTGNGNPAVTCNDDTDPSSLSLNNLRSHPRIIAPGYMWSCMAEKINKDAYLTIMNDSVMANATAFAAMPPTNYSIDGGYNRSGILDVSREVQLRLRSWGYAYKMTNDRSWVQRAWEELSVAAGNNSNVQFGQGPPPHPNGHWNPAHFLDTAEMTAAFAIAFDWMYDAWNTTQKAFIVDWIIQFGLTPGLNQYQTDDGWWKKDVNGNGNWNCVCNSGMLLGALAIIGDDAKDLSQTATKVVNHAIDNIKNNCFNGPYADGTWAETANYWYFGTNAAARAESALVSATGNNQGLNQKFYQTGYYHMYVSGNGGLFNYGDHGPNKFSTNANAMLWWGNYYKQPLLTLFQRDRADALGDPIAMFWYDTSAKGAFWNNLPLDRYFDDPRGSWMSMRSSWTDFNGLFVAMKASALTGHQTHGDLDVGDFVLDAMGTRWAGEYGSAQYLSTDYFSNETQGSTRWQYFRKGTQGQNTLVINKADQSVMAAPSNTWGSQHNLTQTSDINYKPGTNDIAYFVTDMSSAYNQTADKVQRGIRLLNGRRQVLLQDEIAAGVAQNGIQWRIQTNATVSISGSIATLTIKSIDDPNAAIGLNVPISAKTLKVQILSPPNAQFTHNGPPAERLYGTDPDPANGGDPINTGVTTLIIDIPNPSGATTIQTLWQPQWDDLTSADSSTPQSVPLVSWTPTSH